MVNNIDNLFTIGFFGKSFLLRFILSVRSDFLSKVGDHSREWSDGSLFNIYYIKVYGRALLLSRIFSTLLLIHIL